MNEDLSRLFGMPIVVDRYAPPGTVLLVSPDMMHRLHESRSLREQMLYVPDFDQAMRRLTASMSEAARSTRQMAADFARVAARQRLEEEARWYRDWWHRGERRGWWER